MSKQFKTVGGVRFEVCPEDVLFTRRGKTKSIGIHPSASFPGRYWAECVIGRGIASGPYRSTQLGAIRALRAMLSPEFRAKWPEVLG